MTPLPRAIRLKPRLTVRSRTSMSSSTRSKFAALEPGATRMTALPVSSGASAPLTVRPASFSEPPLATSNSEGREKAISTWPWPEPRTVSGAPTVRVRSTA
ncbi:hypothetical protein D3C72_1427530 [compost metagenome]